MSQIPTKGPGKQFAHRSLQASIVIPAHGRSDLVQRCLQSLVEAGQPTASFEIIVVENGKRAGVDAIVDRFRNRLPLKYAYHEAANAGAARNHGASLAVGTLVIFIDDDIKIRAGFVDAYLAAFTRHGSDCFYGGGLSPDYEQQPPAWLIPHLPASARGFSLDCEPGDTVLKPLFLGGNLGVPRELLDRVGGFDLKSPSGKPNSGLVGEETRLQQRLLAMGARGAYVQNADVLHWVPADRCSLDWLINRRRRAGTTEAEVSSTLLGTWCGVPPWMLRKWFSESLHLLTARLGRQPIERNVAEILHRAYLGAYIKRAARRQLGR